MTDSDPKLLLRTDVSLSRYSTFQIGGNARFFAEPAHLNELQSLLAFARSEGIPVLGIGKGSNVLFPDQGFPGLVITFIHYEPKRIEFDPEHFVVTASSGVNLYRLALACRDAGFGGVEFLSHVPGTLGGALMMNAGFSRTPGVKNEIGELVEEITVLTPEGDIRILERSALAFHYRKSGLEGHILLEAKLKLFWAEPEVIQREIEACFSYRNRVQDLRYPSAGSVFKNPESGQGPAGQLIERVGLKGHRIGNAMFSDKHGNFIVNLGGARASEVLGLIHLAQEKVLEKFGVPLEPEIRIIRTEELAPQD